MKKYKVKETKTNKVFIYNENEIKNLFLDNENLLSERIMDKSSYNYVLENPQEFFSEDTLEQDIIEFKEYWNHELRDVLDGSEYYTELIQAKTWTSPRGVEPCFRVLEVIGA